MIQVVDDMAEFSGSCARPWTSSNGGSPRPRTNGPPGASPWPRTSLGAAGSSWRALRESGLSYSQMAPATGSAVATIERDLQAIPHRAPASVPGADGKRHPKVKNGHERGMV
ncbi:MAG TPA: hypothetical protein VEF89_26250 [Solirubrobacteraceae bacterium]|nr:hypothetical protein [Solirubrobacteraceae bacterium]